MDAAASERISPAGIHVGSTYVGTYTYTGTGDILCKKTRRTLRQTLVVIAVEVRIRGTFFDTSLGGRVCIWVGRSCTREHTVQGLVICVVTLWAVGEAQSESELPVVA